MRDYIIYGLSALMVAAMVAKFIWIGYLCWFKSETLSNEDPDGPVSGWGTRRG